MKTDMAKGFHALQVILKTSPGRVKHLWIHKGRNDGRMEALLSQCEDLGISPQFVDKNVLDELVQDNHQGVVAELLPARSYGEKDLYELVSSPDHMPLLLVLDGVTDPHNLGACLRTCDAAGVTAVVVPKDNSAGLTDVARKVASGAADTVPLIVVTNLARALKKMQALGVWVTGTAGEAEATIFDANLRGPRAIVMGAEGKGMRRLTKACCDELVKIPMCGEVSSLNVSVAAGVILFETLRQNNHQS